MALTSSAMKGRPQWWSRLGLGSLTSSGQGKRSTLWPGNLKSHWAGRHQLIGQWRAISQASEAPWSSPYVCAKVAHCLKGRKLRYLFLSIIAHLRAWTKIFWKILRYSYTIIAHLKPKCTCRELSTQGCGPTFQWIWIGKEGWPMPRRPSHVVCHEMSR